MNKIESVKAKVIEVIPEIMEIRIGCVLNLHAGESYGWMTVHQMTSVCKKHKKFREECGMEENGCTAEEAVFGTSGNDEEWWTHTIKLTDIKPYQIVGRPITLADVLHAIGSQKKFLCAVDDQGFIWKWDSSHNGAWIPASFVWNLAENLDKQSEEVHDFLFKILCD